MLDYIFYIIIIAAIAVLIYVVLKQSKGSKDESQDQSLLLMQNQIGELTKQLSERLNQSHESMQKNFEFNTKLIQDISKGSQDAIKEVTQNLTKLEDTNKQVVGFAEQLQSLENILKNPKQRGVLGEYYLEETLKNVLPPNSYQMQYAFKDGEIVDAVVFVKEKIIPIDSKFSLENYEKILNCKELDTREKLERQFKQDLKNRIDETAKYVRPSENTMEFAFMFIPSEAIYYDLLVNKVGAVQVNTRDLIEYAFRDKKVIIVSPTSFLAYLQTVLQGLRALQIEESALEIKHNVEKLSRHLLSYNEFLTKMGNSLGTTVSHFNTASKEFKKIDKDVMKITGKEEALEVLELDKPRGEE